MKTNNRLIRNTLNKIGDLSGIGWIVFPRIPDNRIILFNSRNPDYRFLSNFYPCEIRIDGNTWPHVEAYYQSRKCDKPEYHARILHNKKAYWAKFVGDSRVGNPRIAKKSWFRKHPEDMRSDWDEVKVGVMRSAINAKFTQNANLKKALMKTEDAELIEDSKNDYFWGNGKDGSGENMLGKLLMDLRESLSGDNAN